MDVLRDEVYLTNCYYSIILFGMHIAYPFLGIISNREYLKVEVQ